MKKQSRMETCGSFVLNRGPQKKSAPKAVAVQSRLMRVELSEEQEDYFLAAFFAVFFAAFFFAGAFLTAFFAVFFAAFLAAMVIS
jgi:hypothetical protein